MPRRRRRVLRVLLNPLVVIAVVVAVITAGWVAYTGGTSSIARARPGANMFPALNPTLVIPDGASPGAAPSPSPSGTSSATPAAAAVEPAAAAAGWHVSHSGDAQTSLELADGQVSDKALKLDVDRYGSGDVTLTSPRVNVEPGKSYLFKAFATSDTDFVLLCRQQHSDGSSTLQQLRNPLERPGNSAFTVSDAFNSGATTTSVEYIFRLASKGTMTVEGAYIEAADDVKARPEPAAGANLIPNPGFAVSGEGSPYSWSPYDSGGSTLESGRSTDKDGNYLWTRVSNYKSGEAKWQYEPVPAVADRYFEFGATYRSEREVDVVAEFELANGGRSFLNLDTVPAAGEWTTVRESFQIPEGAKSAMVTLVAHGDGTTGIRDYSLTDVTKPGPLRWTKPMVSITFDDGWQSVYDRAVPELNKHQFRSTQYVNPSSIETPNFMTAAEVQQLHDAGHEIASHSYKHVDLTSISVSRLDEEVRQSEEALAAAGLATDNLAPPYGRSDPQVDWYASKYYNLVRGTGDGINTRQNLEPHDLKVLYITDETTPETLAKALAETKRMNGWLILVYHQIATPQLTGTQENGTIAGDRSTVTSDVLAAQLQLIDDSGIEVQPVAQAYATLQGP